MLARYLNHSVIHTKTLTHTSLKTMQARSSPLLSKLEILRSQRDLLRQEVAALSDKDRELSEHHSAHSQVLAEECATNSHTTDCAPKSYPPPSAQYFRTPMAERMGAGLRALLDPSPSPLAAQSLEHGRPNDDWKIHQMPEQSVSPVVQHQLSVEELKAIVTSSISQLGASFKTHSQPHSQTFTPRSTISQQSMRYNGDSLVSLNLPSIQQPQRSSPPRPAGSAANRFQSHSPYSLPLDRQVHRTLVLPPDTLWSLSSHVTPRLSALPRHESTSLSKLALVGNSIPHDRNHMHELDVRVSVLEDNTRQDDRDACILTCTLFVFR